MYNNLPLTNNYILSATNWWNTSRMLGSRSWVNSSVSRVVLYRSTCSKELKGGGDDQLNQPVHDEA